MITSAAASMVVVFLGFVYSSDVMVKQIGRGPAAAILLDATIVRVALVPSTMVLLGDANWWLPRWLDRALPRIDIEGESKGGPEPLGTAEPGDRAPPPTATRPIGGRRVVIIERSIGRAGPRRKTERD